jgi:LysR family transcriptional regulator, regulator for bpeEF and oprC
MNTIDHIELRALRLFESVATNGSFSETGRAFDLPRAVVSRIVAQLEDQLGVRLFNRTTRKVIVTEEGQMLLQQLRPTLAALRNSLLATQAKTSDAGGVVTLSVAHAFGRHFILPLLKRFKEQHPQTHIDLRLVEGIDDLVDSKVDLVIRQGVLPESSIVARRLGGLKLILAIPVNLKNPKLLDDIKGLPGIGFRIPGTGLLFQWGFERNGERRQILPDKFVSVTDSIEAVVDQVAAGIGIAVVPEYLAEIHIRLGAVKAGLKEYDMGNIPVHLCFASRELMPRRVRILADFLIREIRLGN